MMDTILNLGLNDETVQGLSKNFGDRFAMVFSYLFKIIKKKKKSKSL
jgi:hypothetical protein